jgi:hypothetical protein
MRRTILALTAVFFAPTAVMALTSDRELVGASVPAIQKRQIAPGGVAGSDQGGVLGGDVILAKGDKTGTGGGHGGHKGQKKGGNHGKQKKDKS